ncbi:MAG TPA: PP2C family protein-serine/threonine phosphatase [Tepidisphaeraceae bacterium]|nr:PP2C family protein-serine/threonine phosphatase [Tepidisphaeraceae bacterium]
MDYVTSNFDKLPWRHRLDYVDRMMRDVSLQTEPGKMVDIYGEWIQRINASEGYISLSRRELITPWHRITRSWLWEERGEEIDAWKDRGKQPMLDRGLLRDLIYGEKATIIDELRVESTDPAYEHLKDFKSLQAMPLFEDGIGMNMVVQLSKRPHAFDPEKLPTQLWSSNLFGRATKNLVLSDELRKAYAIVDRELKVVSDIQLSLLPAKLPVIEGLDIAAYYQTSTQAGGDYYDFFELDDGCLGVLIADVSGHGTPAAVMMAVTHSIAHTRDEPPTPPSSLLNFINARLTARYTSNGTFVTAFYGIYNPNTRELIYCSAGHNPPRVQRGCGSETISLEGNRNLPLGIIGDETYTDARVTLLPGDFVIFYTDGITEARDPSGELFGTERLDTIVNSVCKQPAKLVVEQTIQAVNAFTAFGPASDDRTLVVMRVNE